MRAQKAFLRGQWSAIMNAGATRHRGRPGCEKPAYAESQAFAVEVRADDDVPAAGD
jgi:hypothetical protein